MGGYKPLRPPLCPAAKKFGLLSLALLSLFSPGALNDSPSRLAYSSVRASRRRNGGVRVKVSTHISAAPEKDRSSKKPLRAPIPPTISPPSPPGPLPLPISSDSRPGQHTAKCCTPA